MENEDQSPVDPFEAMEATMSEAFDNATAEEAEKPEAPPVEEASAEEEDTTAEAEQAEEAEPDDAEEADQADDDEDGADAEEASLSAPSRWSDADKEAFNALPREAQELVLKRERDVEAHLTRESQKIAENQKSLGQVNNIIEQRREAWAMQGMSPDVAVQQLFALSDFAGRDPQGFVQWFAQQQGIDLGLAGASDDGTDPQIQALKAEIAELRGMEYQRTQQQQQQQQQTIHQVIQEFANDAAQAPHFKQLENEIAGILPAVKQDMPGASPKEWLKAAYDKAVWMNEETRAAELAKAQAAKRQTASARAAKAKKAASGNVRGNSAGAEHRESRSFEETMSDAYDRAMGAA